MADDIRIVRQRSEEGFDGDGKPFHNVVVEFKVGEDGPFTRRFPYDGFQGSNVRQALADFAQQLKTARGEGY